MGVKLGQQLAKQMPYALFLWPQIKHSVVILKTYMFT